METEEEKVKASPRIPHVRQGQPSVVYEEIELIPQPAINIFPGRVLQCLCTSAILLLDGLGD